MSAELAPKGFIDVILTYDSLFKTFEEFRDIENCNLIGYVTNEGIIPIIVDVPYKRRMLSN